MAVSCGVRAVVSLCSRAHGLAARSAPLTARTAHRSSLPLAAFARGRASACFPLARLRSYMVMEYMPRGDCHNLLEQLGFFEEDLASFYLAETIEGARAPRGGARLAPSCGAPAACAARKPLTARTRPPPDCPALAPPCPA